MICEKLAPQPESTSEPSASKARRMAATISPVIMNRGAAAAVNHAFIARGARPLSDKLWDHSTQRLVPRKVLAVIALKVQHFE
jgi:hypothetical protein